MSREIKFRIWDKLEKRFINSSTPNQGHYIITLNGVFHNLQNGSGGDDYEIQQYTGLKDKNNADIYEGDIIFFPAVEGVYSYQKQKNVVVKHSFICGNAHLGEVVGNIFENPELLKQ